MLEQRADCEYYAPRHYHLLEELKSSPFQLKRLRDITQHIVDGPFGSAVKAEDYVGEGIPFIRVADVTRGDGTIKTDDLVFISHEAHSKIFRSRAIPGDVIIAKTGATMGAASVLPQDIVEANIRGDLALVGSLGSLLHADYLSTYINTSIGYRLFWRLNSGSTRGRVVISNLRKLPVLWPDEQTQMAVVRLINEGRKAKQEKMAEANGLLASIDDYLLDQLSISLPAEPENTVSNRIFTAQRKELTGSRFDPFFNEPFFVAFQKTIEQRADYMRIREFGHVQRGVVYSSQDETDDGVPVLRANNINLTLNELDLSDLVRINPELEFKQSQRAKIGDILICAASGSKEHAGKACYINEEPNAYLGGFMMALRCQNKNVVAKYVAYYMQSKLFRMTIFRHLGGTNINNISIEMLSRLGIVVPTKKTQERIVSEISCLRSRAKELRQQGENELSAAKHRIEAMLLGMETP